MRFCCAVTNCFTTRSPSENRGILVVYNIRLNAKLSIDLSLSNFP